MVPSYLENYFHMVKTTAFYDNRGKFHGLKYVLYTSEIAWNKLPVAIKGIKDLGSFKRVVINGCLVC